MRSDRLINPEIRHFSTTHYIITPILWSINIFIENIFPNPMSQNNRRHQLLRVIGLEKQLHHNHDINAAKNNIPQNQVKCKSWHWERYNLTLNKPIHMVESHNTKEGKVMARSRINVSDHYGALTNIDHIENSPSYIVLSVYYSTRVTH